MSFGKKKSSNSDKYQSQILTALQPANFYSPFGKMEGGTYTPIESADQVAARGLTDRKLLSTLGAIPDTFDVNQFYNNPFYGTVLNMTRQPIDMQRQQDERNLSNQLSARNQLGSSYDAYSKNLLAQRYDDAYRQAESRARLSSADAYTTSLQSALSTLGALRNESAASQDQALQPAKLALNYQQVSSPLQQSLANYYIDRRNQEQAYDQFQQQQQLRNIQVGAQVARGFLPY